MARFGTRRRALLLTVLVPGAGHACLRQWLRGGLWAGSYLIALGALSPYGPVLLGSDDELLFVLNALDGGLSPLGAAFPLSIIGLCLLDVHARVRIGDEASGRR